jgi:hypothetical protein
MRKEAILGDSIFVIHEFLSPEECECFIEESEAQGYEDAPITTARGPVLRKDIRNNNRVMVDDPDLAASLFQRAKPILPPRLGQWEILGFNERWRYYRYDPGQRFNRHYDGSFFRRHGEQSLLTFMIYLNAGFTGGATEFYHPNDQLKASVTPQQGMALVFIHEQLHEGTAVESGRKYVLRTDVMYVRR